MKVKQSKVLRTRVYSWAAGVTLAACLLGYNAAPSYASEVSEAYAPIQAEIETSAAIGSIKDSESAHNYIQPTAKGGFLMLNIEDDTAASVVHVTYGKLDNSLETVWKHQQDLNVQPGTSSRGVQRETSDGGLLFLLDYTEPNGMRDVHASRLDADGNPFWSKTLPTDGLISRGQDSQVGLETLEDGSFLVSYLNLSEQSFTVLKYTETGDLLWNRTTTGVTSGWLVGSHNGYYALLNSSDGPVGVQADVYGRNIRDVHLDLGAGKEIAAVCELPGGHIAVTGLKGNSKRTQVLSNGLQLFSNTEDYASDRVYLPEEQLYVQFIDQYDPLGKTSKMHGITITGLKGNGTKVWETKTHYKEDNSFAIRYDTGLIYKIPSGYAVVTSTTGVQKPTVLDFAKILIPE
ncbi:hypothetical protein L8C07_06515 [Paenibacillus sp. CMAA1739]|uniref:hypothetical protein n=1 Tax=Paenibacillus ottowii TaxID=2315729 RepID=UPI002DBAC950|nr:hypothetical protein [Paenibacillus sp. CMAA1739]MEC4565592.1 hypothetical protein [Paenibacillus sp. CMAA1739]